MHLRVSFYPFVTTFMISFFLVLSSPVQAGITANCNPGDAPTGYVTFPCDQGGAPVCVQVGTHWVCDLATNEPGWEPQDPSEGWVVTRFHQGDGVPGPEFSAWGENTVDRFCCTLTLPTPEPIHQVELLGTDRRDRLFFQDTSGAILFNSPFNTAPTLTGQQQGNDGDDDLLGSPAISNYLDRLLGDAGHDFIVGDTGDDDLFGGGGNDELCGNGGQDKLFGDAGIDALDGGAAADEMHGGAGPDTLCDDDDGDRYFGDGGGDLLWHDNPLVGPSSAGSQLPAFPNQCNDAAGPGWASRFCLYQSIPSRPSACPSSC